MWEIVLIAFVATSANAQYHNPVPVVGGAPPPPPPPQNYPEKPVYGVDSPFAGPYPPPPPPPYPPHNHHHHHNHYAPYDSSEEVHDTCNSCHTIKASCHDKPKGYHCEKPRVTYFNTAYGCQKAVLTCRGGEHQWMQITTKYNEVLTEGFAADKLLKCRKGKWTTYDIKDREVSFREVRCLKKKDHHSHDRD